MHGINPYTMKWDSRAASPHSTHLFIPPPTQYLLKQVHWAAAAGLPAVLFHTEECSQFASSQILETIADLQHTGQTIALKKQLWCL